MNLGILENDCLSYFYKVLNYGLSQNINDLEIFSFLNFWLHSSIYFVIGSKFIIYLKFNLEAYNFINKCEKIKNLLPGSLCG